MTNKEITKVIFNNAEISALYYGDVLFWKNENATVEYGVNTFAGKFTDDSTESDWYWEPNKTFYLQSNKINIADKVDPTTKEFCFDYTVNNLMSCFNNKKIEKIYHLPLCKGNDLYEMIYYCTSLTSINLSDFDTSNCTNMECMFTGCNALTSLDLSNFDTSKVTNMKNLFKNCRSLETLNLNFNTTAVTNMGYMFDYCDELTKVTGVFEGTKVDLDLQYSPLTNESAMVFINGLANVGETKTIKFKSSTYNTLTPEQIAIATSKGWTVISI